jgi:hypothetical protein
MSESRPRRNLRPSSSRITELTDEEEIDAAAPVVDPQIALLNALTMFTQELQTFNLNNQNNNRSNVKMKLDVTKFNGKRKELRYFLKNVETYFVNNPNECNTDQKKIAKAVSFFESTPQRWFYNLNNSEELTWQHFKEKLVHVYGDSNEVESARMALSNLSQKGGSASDYALSFQEHCYLALLGEAALVSMFKKGLKPEIQKVLALEKSSLGDDLEKIIQRAIEVDDQFHEINKIYRQDKDKKHNNQHPNRNNNTSPKRNSDHFQNDDKKKDYKAKKVEDKGKSVTFGDDGNDKKKRCAYCHKPGHEKKDCYKLKNKKKEDEKKPQKSTSKVDRNEDSESLKD